MSCATERPHRGIARGDAAWCLPRLEPGDHLEQPEFHRRYVQMPAGLKVELIGGVVYLPAALRRPHGRSHNRLNWWLTCYEDGTPGVEAYDNATTIMGADSEPQPDACLIVLPECGGQMRVTEDDYLEGGPEFIGEVASSTESYDLHSKKCDYERAGVKEYLVVALQQQRVFWFVNRDGQFKEQPPDADGILRSEVFPGLWLDPQALLELNAKRLMEVLRSGLATPGHAAFVQQLAGGSRGGAMRTP